MTHSSCDTNPPWVCHASCICVTKYIHMWDTTRSSVWYDPCIVRHEYIMSVTWLLYMCDMTHSYVWRDEFIRGIWPNHGVTRIHRIRAMTPSYVRQSLFTIHTCICYVCRTYEGVMAHIRWIRVTPWLVRMCEEWITINYSHTIHTLFTHASVMHAFCVYVQVCASVGVKIYYGCLCACVCLRACVCLSHDSFLLAMGLIQGEMQRGHLCMCAMTHLYVWHDSCVSLTWLICTCDMTHLCDMTHA